MPYFFNSPWYPTIYKHEIIEQGGDYKSIWDGSLINNVYINYSDGAEVAYNGWAASDYLDLNDNTDGYFYRAGAIAQATYCAFYDDNKNFITACPAADNYGRTTIPNNARYVRLSTANTSWGGPVFIKI